MDGTILDSLLTVASQYSLQASLCADGETMQRRTETCQLEMPLEVRHYCQHL